MGELVKRDEEITISYQNGDRGFRFNETMLAVI
jgi:hypothetical protein